MQVLVTEISYKCRKIGPMIHTNLLISGFVVTMIHMYTYVGMKPWTEDECRRFEDGRCDL